MIQTEITQSDPNILCALPTETMTFDEVREYLNAGILDPANTAEKHKAVFARLVASEEPIKAELGKMKLAQLRRMASYHAQRENKSKVIDSVFSNLMHGFVLTDTISCGFGDKWEDVLARYVAKVTDESLAAHCEAVAKARAESVERREAAEKATENPQTLDEFDTCIRRRGIRKLTETNAAIPRKQYDVDRLIHATGIKCLSDEELERYDELQAALGHERRAKQLIEKATIRRIEIGEGNYMEIAKTFHTKRQCDQWIVVLAEREDRTTFEELCIAARKLGGDYQRAWAPANSPGGFAFSEEGQAKKFVQLQSRDLFEMRRLEKLVANRDRVRNNAVNHFGGLSERMEDRATENYHRERKENTERRIMQAERARDGALEDLAMAGTLKNYADALAKRLTLHTDRIRWRTHAEAFNDILNRANNQMALVEYPWPRVGAHALATIVDQIKDRDGSKLVSQRMIKMIKAASNGEVRFANSDAADMLRHFYRRARMHRVRGWALDSIRVALGHYKRVRLMGLDTLPELRAALREHIGKRVEVTEMTRAEKVMRDMYPGQFPPDYFPTPRDVVEIMLDYADAEDGMTFAEPQAGSGHIANVVREMFPNSDISLIEISGLLCKALEAQGWAPRQEDFLKVNNWSARHFVAPWQGFDRIIMNPPFGCDGLGTDIDHVQHAYKFLRPGGRLVSLMSDGVFYRGDGKAEGFREWLEFLDGSDFELPEGAFLNGDRPTSWAARVVVIDKPLEG